MAEFNVAQYLASQGLALEGAGGAPGVFKVRSGEKTGTFDANEFLRATAKLNPRQVSITANSPDDAVNISPLGVSDRLKTVGLGGTASGIGTYLKSRFDDFSFNSANEMVVKDKGVWHKVDPDGLGAGDGWDMAKELAKDVVDLADVGVSGVTSGVGAAVGGPMGAAAGGGLAKAAITAMGRVVGTYDATPLEQVRDVAVDAVLSGVGEKIAVGARERVWPALKAGLAKLGNAAPAIKEQTASLLSAASGTKPYNLLRAINETDAVDQALQGIKQATPKGATFETALETAKGLNINEVLADFSQVGKAFSGVLNKLEAQVIKEAPANVGFDPSQQLKQFVQGLVGAGLVGAKYDSSGALVALAPVKGQKLLERFVNQGMNADSASALATNLFKYAKTIEALAKKPAGEGAKAYLSTRRALDRFYYNMVDGNEGLERLLTPMTSQLRVGIKNAFSGAPDDIAKTLASVSRFDDYFKEMRPNVLMAERMVDAWKQGNKSTLEAFVNKLGSEPENHFTAKKLIDTVGSLIGKRSSVPDRVAAMDMVKLAPTGTGQLGNWPRLVAAAGATALGGPIAGGVTLGAMSPRAAFSLIKGFNGLKRLSNAAPSLAVNQPEVWDNAVREVFKNYWQPSQAAMAAQLTAQATGKQP